MIMKHQKIANFLSNVSNEPSKFRTKKWVEVLDESRETYAANTQMKFKTSMLRSSLCDYSDVYILVKGRISVNNTAAECAAANNIDKKVISKNLRHLLNA